MNTRQNTRESAVKHIRKAMALYKRPAEKAKAAAALQRDVSDATETQQAQGNAACSGVLDTLAERCTDAGACQSPATCHRGAGGVCALAGALKANSFTSSGKNPQCSIPPGYDAVETDFGTIPVSPTTLSDIFAKYRKEPAEVNGREKAPRLERAQGAEVSVVPTVGQAWPSECEVLITGRCLNPRLMAGVVLEGEAKRRGRAVTLWKTWKQERSGMVVRAKLERGSGREALYAVVVPEKAAVATPVVSGAP